MPFKCQTQGHDAERLDIQLQAYFMGLGRFEYMSLAVLLGNKVLLLGPGILPTSLHRLDAWLELI